MFLYYKQKPPVTDLVVLQVTASEIIFLAFTKVFILSKSDSNESCRLCPVLVYFMSRINSLQDEPLMGTD